MYWRFQVYNNQSHTSPLISPLVLMFKLTRCEKDTDKLDIVKKLVKRGMLNGIKRKN
jgi:hypothetical protein